MARTAPAKGLIVAAPASGSGKTLITLGLLAACRSQGLAVAPAKVGPDYIDPAFHAAASGRTGATLDTWAMSPATLGRYIERAAAGAQMILCEGVMGLMDGAQMPPSPLPDQMDGSTASLARLTGWPVVLVVDCRGMAASAAAIVAGFAALLPAGTVAGVIFNRVGSPKHRAMIESAMAAHLPHIAILGFVPPLADLVVPSRHLGLVQAAEHPDLPGFLDAAGTHMARHIDIGRLATLARPDTLARPHSVGTEPGRCIPPLGKRIAVARDAAFAFSYPDLLADWRDQGAEITLFSPLDDQAPDPASDAVYLPGGYPELHGPRLAAGQHFLNGLRRLAAKGAHVYGECGGYMTLGRAIVDGQGRSHAMADLLPVVTSFEKPQRNLGYRQVVLTDAHPLGEAGALFRGHEFHFARQISSNDFPLWESRDATGMAQDMSGCRVKTVSGSFIHLLSIV